MNSVKCAASLLAISLAAGSVVADQITIPLNDSNAVDNFLYNNGPTTNFGPNGIFFYDNRGTQLDKGRPIIRFDLSTEVPPCSTITKVEYQLWLVDYTFIDVNNGNAAVPWTFSLYPMLVAWDENTSTWNQRLSGVPWSTPGMAAGVDYEAAPASSLVVSTPANRYISWDITSLYLSWVNGTRANYGFHLRGPAGDPTKTTSSGDTTDGVFRANSSEYADDFRRPHLVITFTPGSCACNADFNGDGFLDFTDFDAFVLAFEAGTSNADFNGDGFLDFTDFDAFVGAFEAGC